jgi:hypothetical protein
MGRPPQEAELKITLKNDATIYVLGADNADSLRGMYLDGTVNDEYALFKPSVFPQVIRPALSDRNGWSVFASTPRGKNLFHDVCEQARKNPREWFSLILSAETSGIIPARELADLRRDMDPEEFAQEYLCSFDSALKGAIYSDEMNAMFMDARVVVGRKLYDPALPTHCVFDLGFSDATVCIWFQLGRDGTIRIVACEATTQQSIMGHIERIHRFEGELGSVFLPHDARAKNLQTGASILEQFLANDITPRLVPMHKVRDGIAAARKIFPLVSIDQDMTGDLVEALKSYRRTWDDTKLMFSDIPLHDWASDFADCFRYMAIAAGMLGFISRADAVAAATAKPSSQYNLTNLFEDNEARRQQVAARIA